MEDDARSSGQKLREQTYSSTSNERMDLLFEPGSPLKNYAQGGWVCHCEKKLNDPPPDSTGRLLFLTQRTGAKYQHEVYEALGLRGP
jgi:hypothetical protein